MAITNASRLADFGSGIGTQGSVIQVDNANKRVGLGTTNPQSTLQVGIAITMDGTAGVITAVSYHGDGSALTGMASTDNIITGVAVTVGGILRVTDTTQSTSTTTGSVIVSGGVGIAKSLNVGGNISVGGTLTYEDVTNVDSIGIITARSGIKFGAAGVGGTIRANGDTTLAGVVTASSFVGDGSGLTNLVGTGVTNNVNTVNLNVISGVTTLGNDVIFTVATANVTWDKSEDDLVFPDNARAKFGTDLDLHIYHNGSNSVIREEGTGNLNIQTTGGNVDILVNTTETAAKFISDGAVELYNNNTKRIETTSSGAITTGIHTVTVGTDLDGYKVEEGSYDTNALNGEFDFEFENGHVQTHTGSTAVTYFPDFRVSSSQSLSSVMGVGDVVSATLIVTASNTAHYCTTGIKIDNSTSNVTIEWIGSSAPSAGKGAGYDIYSFTIQKTAATPAYLVIVNATDAG